MAQEPAHTRAPIEIWDTILNLAITSPLLPHPDDDIVDLYLLFTKHCDSQGIQRAVEGVRTRLRLVCRGWNASIRDKGVRMVIGPSQTGKPHRYEDWGEFFCDCGRCIRSMGLPMYPTSTDDSTSTAERFSNLIILTSNSELFPIDVTHDVAPRLRALRYKCWQPTAQIGSILQTKLVQYLSHLELTGISPFAMQPVAGSINLPRLLVLSLRFTTRHYYHVTDWQPESAPNTALSGWILPSVRTLKVKGTIPEAFVPEMTGFLSRKWKTVINLHINLALGDILFSSLSSRTFEIKPTFWSSFPNLHNFGVNRETLEHNPAPRPTYYQFCLVIDFIWDDVLNQSRDEVRAHQILDDWKPSTIVLLYSWGEVIGPLRRDADLRSAHSVTPHARRPSAIFAAAIARNIRLLDVYRTSLFHEDHKECLDLLQNWRAMNGSRASTASLSGDGDDEANLELHAQ